MKLIITALLNVGDNAIGVTSIAIGVTSERLPDATFHSDQDKLDSRPSRHRRDALMSQYFN